MIEINNVSKSYDDKEVLRNISLNIQQGQIHGIIGENSAGKTTLIKCIAGIYKPNDGSITLDGRNVFDNPEANERIAYIADVPDFMPLYSVSKIVDMNRRFFDRFDVEKFNSLNELFKIPMKSIAMSMSKGQKMRLNIMIQMAKNADYILMDEPSSGLDPLAKKSFFNILVNEVEKNNTGIFISSHNLDGLERVSDVITMINKGVSDNNVVLEDIKNRMSRINAVFPDGVSDDIYKDENILNITNTGKIYSMIINDYSENMNSKLKRMGASFIEKTELTLEEYFIAVVDK